MKTKNIICTLLFLLSFYSCVEEIDLITETNFESAIVIEATITNELKFQEIKLSRTYALEEEGPNTESGASVKVIFSGGEYNFIETEPGIYKSNIAFAAQQNIDYKLEVQSSDGSQYSSTTMQLTQQTQIDDLYFERGFNENMDEGISVFVDSYDPTGNSKFYRYTYEETYKIIAPRWSPLDLVATFGIGNCPSFSLELKTEQQLICYNTVNSNSIIIENTNLYQEDRVDDFRVRFLNRDNAIISHRYSILVNQYIQSKQAHEFYKSLKELSETESIFSDTQPGFLNGNVFSTTSPEEKVIGFFEVSSVDSRRIYFNYEDLFPGEFLPPYFVGCTPFAPPLCTMGGTSPLYDSLTNGFKYYQENDDIIEGEGIHDIVAPECGDCRVLGNNFPPDFWEE